MDGAYSTNEDIRNVYKIVLGKCEGKNLLRDLGSNMRTILMWGLTVLGCECTEGIKRTRTGSNNGLF